MERITSVILWPDQSRLHPSRKKIGYLRFEKVTAVSSALSIYLAHRSIVPSGYDEDHEQVTADAGSRLAIGGGTSAVEAAILNSEVLAFGWNLASADQFFLWKARVPSL